MKNIKNIMCRFFKNRPSLFPENGLFTKNVFAPANSLNLENSPFQAIVFVREKSLALAKLENLAEARSLESCFSGTRRFISSPRFVREKQGVNVRVERMGIVPAERAGDIRAEQAENVPAERAGIVTVERTGIVPAERTGIVTAEKAGDIRAEQAGVCRLQAPPFSRFSFSRLKMSALFVASLFFGLFFGLSCGFANAEDDNTEKMRILTKDIDVSFVDGHIALLVPEEAQNSAGNQEDEKKNKAESPTKTGGENSGKMNPSVGFHGAGSNGSESAVLENADEKSDQGINTAQPRNEETIKAGKRHENGEIRRYRLFIAVPEKPAPREGFPLVLLLDGNTTFKPAIRQAPDAVIVAIGYSTDEKKEIVKRRFYDLTSYAPADKIPLREGMEAPKTGGEEEFRSLIEKKILPEILMELPVNRANVTLFGHSLGGLFVMKSFLSAESHGFSTYCAADPSIWWNGHEFMEKLAAYHKPEGFKSRLLIETSGIKTHHKNVTESNKKPVKDLHSGPNGKDVSEILRKAKAVDNTFYSFSDKNHGTMLAPAIKDCLHFALNAKNFKQQKFPHKLPSTSRKEMR
ncbi:MULTISPECIES: alpha/beta hydrolase [Bartonella]|uniref:alpha/beta hydrolase n=1 Tax=Bartonella TaxID=773 RepID=UPI0018DB9863|nr:MULTISPECIES: alpha/beta hydrolase-fold protein [Bartonella]MBH9993878.1 alpha/beta hydrolase [Bartonella sp. P0291]MBH9997776.1 alpha/beta hydrolase [Bartonella sp. M0192]MBH9999934.1 alpha/beta hydrolase [Bartonella sp. M0191]MBI0009159.1 alpha/beta hydrolase [Bartonella sp. M0193]MBI0011652.1 alpha/beta hydrolase [Bartonella apihabitans]